MSRSTTLSSPQRSLPTTSPSDLRSAGSAATASSRPAARRARLLVAGIALACAAALTACGSSATSSGVSAAGTSAPASGGDHLHELTIDSGWVKAGSGMTAAFGTIHNDGSHPVTIVKGSSNQAGMVQLHTMEKQPDGSMKMTEKSGGFVIPAGGTLALTPGGDHIMLMDLPASLANGQQVDLAMVADDGAQSSWTLPVRSFAGAEESYAPGATGTPSVSGMPHMSGTPKR